ncbi:MAG: glycoside hydrolase family 3 C-terminal domain-containing protein, partial [Actinobacteria bacterium]|nr:glycoside hydrolase family 3 C-terminal domain-containing protein [Actinomycetota bacterium]
MDARVMAWLSQMTTQEKCRLLGGASTWRTHAIERLGIPAIKMSDGPNGVRGESLGSKRTPGVSIPVGVAIGASFDTDLALELGQLLGREAVRKSTHIVLAPTINIQRTPIGGRNFECLSEDAELTAQLAINLVRGVQHSDVCVTLKHFAGNDTERDRHTVNAQIDERTLREIYLRPFEAAVIDGEAWGLMSSYNLLNGEHSSQQFELLQQILRNEWGFDGVIVSDWFGFHDTAKSVKAGLDIAMPGPETIYGEKLEQAIARGEVFQHDLDERVAAILQVILRTHAESRSADNAELSVDEPAERDLCRRAAAAGTVLVCNKNNALPLIDSQLKTIAVIGPNAKNTRVQGGGSSSMQALSRKSILSALQDRFGSEKIIHEVGVSIDKMAPIVGASSLRTPSGEPGLRIDYYNNADCAGEIVYTDTIFSSLVVFFGSCPVGVNPENFSIRITGSFIAERDGEHSVSLVVTGPARFSFANEVLVDDPQGKLPRSDAYFGLASQEQISQHNIRAGDTRQINITMSTRAGFSAMRLGISPPKDVNAISRAVDAAAHADVAIVVVGTNDEWETEGSDRDTIALPGDQDEIVHLISQVAKRVIVVVNAGSPVAMPWLEDVD